MKINRKSKNQGFSLIEVIVVLAIVSIVIGISAVSISLANSRNAEKCAKLIDSALESARMSSMAQAGSFLFLLDGSTNCLTIDSSVSGVTEEIQLPARVNVEIAVDGNSFCEVGTELCVEFDKSGGGIDTLVLDGSTIASEDYHTVTITAANDSGNRKVRILLVHRTGKHYVEF